MKDFKTYLKDKLKKQVNIVGKAELTPPPTTSVLQSSSALAVIDMLGEGPIEGLVTKDGRYAKGLKLFESFYLNKTPVKQQKLDTPTTKDIPFSAIKNVDRLTSTAINQSLDNIISRLSGESDFTAGDNGVTNTKIAEVNEFKTELAEFMSLNSGLERFGFAEYDITSIFTATDLISGRLTWQDSVPHLVTVFDFENFLSQNSGSIVNSPIKRQLKIENNDTIKIPDDIHFCAPIFTSGQYGPMPGDSVGKIQNLTKVDHFGGGGIFFFEIGDTDAEIGDKFNTGKFFVDSTSDVTDVTGAITSGITGNYDVFVYDSNAISLESTTSTQITPVKGLTDGSNVKVGFISDLYSTYNYSNVALSFRNGYEQQPVLDGHSKSKQDFVAKQLLIGPLVYGGKATGVSTAGSDNDPAATGVGVGGYSDVRNAGDFSAWMTNPPLEHDLYAYTHIVRRSEVDRVEPSISIDGLSDTIAVGDDAGVQRPASIAVGITYGFEGDAGESGALGNDQDITPSVGQLLSGGNSIKSIALGQYKKKLNKIYTSLIQSSYMTTITEVDDLPVNEDLKNAKVDQATIPGLTDALVTEFNLTSGQELFPGNSWKDVNRYMKIQKLSHETDSTLLTREVSVSYFTEIINQNFTFPYAALGASIFDARNFAQQPSREFDVRLKKVLIPSNYEPLNTDGSDKRFVESSKRYGLRSIFKFNGTPGAGNRSENFARASKSIKLGPHNFEISLKIKFGDVSSKNNLSYYLLDMLSKDSGSNTLNDDRLGLIQRGKSDGGDGSTTTNPVLVLFSPNEGDTTIDIPAGLSTSIVYQIKIKRVGDNLTLSMHNYETGELIGESTDTGYGNDSVNYDVLGQKGLRIGAAFNEASKISAGSQIADLIIKKNGEITNWWDGTIIDTVRGGLALRDKVGGSHADISFTPTHMGSVVEDTDFQFGKNKEILYNGHWDGTFKLGWTDNPAWILYDLMINPIYGIGNHIDDREDVNVFKLFEIARYCDAVDADGLFDGVPDSTLGLEPRFSANIRLSEPKNAYEVIGNIASIFRAISFWDGSSLTFNSDRPKPISALFNNGNVYDGTFNYADISSAARFTRVEVPYSDAKDEFALKFEYVEDEERIRKYGVIVSKVNGIGCTSKSQARRMGKYIMLSNKMETELVNFEVGNEACLLEPGDIIRIDDEVKQFEINYGRILEIETGTPGTESPYFIVEDQIDTGSIITGDSFGGLYTYSNEPQKELSTLYDISNFNAKLTFGTDNNVVTGKIPIETIEGSDKSPVTKFYITGINKVANGIKLFVNSGDSNFKTITGVRHGQFFNVELDTQVTGEYKIVSIKPTENNLFKIDALQYERRKFDKVEAEDFDLEENTYNIGIPLHTVNRPSAPTFNFEIFQTSNLSYSITGDINGAGGSNETKYRVTLLKTNLASPYVQKEFLKDTSDSSDGAGTPFRINNIVDGNYTVRVTALRNPESSPSIEKTFSIQPPTVQYIKPLIYKINGDLNISQIREHGTGYGEIQSLSKDCDYNIDVCDIYGRSVTISQSDLSIDVYAKTGEDYNLIKRNYKENQYTFTEVQNRLTYGQMNTGFQLRFDLIQNEQTVDTSYYNTTII